MTGRMVARMPVLFVLFLAAALCATSLVRNMFWSDDLALWGDTVKKSPGRARPNYEYGIAAGKAGDAQAAFAFIERSRQLDASYFSRGLGMAQALGVDIAGRGYHGNASVRARPPDRYASIEQLVKQGLLDEAIKRYRALLAKNPRQPEVHNRLGRLYYGRKQLREAVREFEEAIRLDPDFGPAHSNLGFIFFGSDHLERAVYEFKEAIRLDPLDPEPHAKLGRAYLQTGQLDDAVSELEEALRIDPFNETARRYLPDARAAREAGR
jgi:tetratricopeptide (TPR) repeat protein